MKRKERSSRLPAAHFVRFTTLDLLCKSVVGSCELPVVLRHTPLLLSRVGFIWTPLIYIPSLAFVGAHFIGNIGR